MNASEQDFWAEQADDPEVRIDGKIDPQVHDAYWQTVYWSESYYRSDRSWDDYAPAYCVGYCGYAQYGGCYEDAEKSLCANWLRIQGDSRLQLDEALQAIRAAWDHAARSEALEPAAEDCELEYMPLAAQAAAAAPQFAAA